MPSTDVKKHIAEFKTEVLVKLVEGKPSKEVISIYRSFNINKSQISKWKMAKDKIIAAAADRKVKKLTKVRSATKHKQLYQELLKVFQETRSKGRHVDFNWIYSNAKKITHELTGDPNAIVKQHVIANFIKLYNLKRRKIQRNKLLPKEQYHNRVEKWYSTLRERCIRTGATDQNYHKKRGIFLPHQGWMWDESPLPFSREITMTYEEIQPRDEENREKRIWTPQLNTGNSKHFRILQICFRSTGEQPCITIIFRGQGLWISAVEKKALDPDVDVYFQKNAWANTMFSLELVETTLKPFVNKDTGNLILFLDNLSAHVDSNFWDVVKAFRSLAWFGEPGATDIWQPVDGRYASILKALIRNEFFDWLDNNENMKKWYREDLHITANERRILVTHWVGNAYRKLTSSKYDKLH